MRVLLMASCLLFALPMAAQAQSCRGLQSLDLGGGTTACVVAIEMNSITTTTNRDDGASSSKRKQAQPLVAAAMTGPLPANRNAIKKQMLAMCKAMQSEVKAQFSDMKYNRTILYMDWRKAGGELEGGYSSAKCKGFSFFGNVTY